ncbi:hypothetical protein P154DRAFT_233672 [Amniculicola lignicola CBS 123094]|uniref:Uncharacterized protein n=1 Tax=Amniculicola lignicola CBS 123094 TaxID=1392246 RepID=A0A6A5WB29_9PLEO|nr:hypothetical protein P154DRAFT_233672 [Amniculicola lignicola CBS 123094]
MLMSMSSIPRSSAKACVLSISRSIVPPGNVGDRAEHWEPCTPGKRRRGMSRSDSRAITSHAPEREDPHRRGNGWTRHDAH